MLFTRVVNLRKVTAENLKFRIDLQVQIIDCWSKTQLMIIFSRSLDCSKKFDWKIQARAANANVYMAFRHGISFETDLTLNFWLL